MEALHLPMSHICSCGKASACVKAEGMSLRAEFQHGSSLGDFVREIRNDAELKRTFLKASCCLQNLSCL